MTAYDIDAEFAALDANYPGSKRKRREATPVAEESAWDAKPIVKKLGGVDTEFFLLGALANALGKSPVTIRLWERKTYIPKSPYRLPATTKAGKTVPGKRVFTRELIDIAVQEFAKRGLLGAARVEWNQHADLTIALYERWSAITETAN
jgi:hypothetical protein